MTHLETLRTIVRRSEGQHLLRPIDPDLAREAGMDRHLARLLQMARDLDIEQADIERIFGSNATSCTSS